MKNRPSFVIICSVNLQNLRKIDWSRWGESWWAVGLYYLLLTMLMMWPTSFLVNERLFGDPWSDFWKHAWGHWWFMQMLYIGRLPLFCDLVNAPAGGYIFIADPFNCLCDGFLMRFLPFSVAYNSWVILNVWGGCMASWLLACYFVKDRRACLVAGSIYGLSAYMLAYPVISGVSETLNSAWMPLYILFCHRVVDRGSFSDIIGAAVFFFLTAFSCWYYGEFMVVYSATILVYRWGLHLYQQRLWSWQVRSWRQLKARLGKFAQGMGQAFKAVLPSALKVAASMALAVVLVSPFALMFHLVVSDPANIIMPDKAPKRSIFRFQKFMGNDSPWSISNRGIRGFHNYTNLLGFVLPGKGNATVTVTIDRLTRIHYLGWIALLLAYIGRKRRRELSEEELLSNNYWFGAGIFFLILSLGLKATISDWSTWGIPNPVYIFMYIFFPMFHKVAVPFRYLAIALLALGVLASFGLRQLCRGQQNLLKWGAALAVPVCMAAEVALVSPLPWPLSYSPAQVPAIYEMIAREEGDFAIIDFPFERPNTRLIPGEYFYYQTVHRKRIPYRTSGVLSTEVARNVFMEELSNSQFGVPTSEAIAIRMTEGVKRLKALGFRYLILHRDIMGELMLGYLQRALKPVLGEPAVFADGTVVYLLEPRQELLRKASN
ncbi:hypothetical protein IJT17_00540 [bacterium]|nr:hypothetical protein [bacterium]